MRIKERTKIIKAWSKVSVGASLLKLLLDKKLLKERKSKYFTAGKGLPVIMDEFNSALRLLDKLITQTAPPLENMVQEE